MGLLEDILLNPFLWGTIIVVVLIAYAMRSTLKERHEVLYLRERDFRGSRLTVNKETAKNVECHPRGDIPKRFYKFGHGYTFTEMGRTVVRFLAKEGTAYTMKAASDPIIITLAETLRTLWGAKFYDEIPKVQRQMVEEGKIGVAVDLESLTTPSGFTPISEEEMHDEDDQKMMHWYTRAARSSRGQQIYMGILWGGAGFAICLVLVNFGVLRAP